MFNWDIKASNAILLDEVEGKGRYFKTRFLEAGLVRYSFGVCLLRKDVIDKFVQQFVGCPVIIDHQDVTSDNVNDVRCGSVCHVWYDEQDGWYWMDGIITSEEALSLINEGYNVSCQYEITEYANNTDGALHNGNEYDKVILNGKPEHLAIVKNPRYEDAMIAVNAIAINEDDQKQFRTADDGHVYPLEYSKSFGELYGHAADQLKKLKRLESEYNTHLETYLSDIDEGRRRCLELFLDHKKEEINKIMKDLKAMNANDEKGKWITVKGTHIFIKDGQSVEEAIEKQFGSGTESDEAKKNAKLLEQMHQYCKDVAQRQIDEMKDKYSKEDADFDEEKMKEDVKFLKDEGYSIEETAEHLGLDEDEVRMSGVYDEEDDNNEASNSIVDQLKEGLYDIAANKIIGHLENEGFLKK